MKHSSLDLIVQCLQIIVYVVDGSGYEDRRPSSDLTVLINELRHHDRKLMGKPSVVFLNKMDVEGTVGRRIKASVFSLLNFVCLLCYVLSIKRT